MRHLVLSLLFIFTVQIKIYTEPSKEENSNREPVHSPSILKGKCSPGYILDCRVIGMYKGNNNPPRRCFCIEDKGKEKKVSETLKQSFNISSSKINEKFKPKISPAFSLSQNIICPKGYFYQCNYFGEYEGSRCFCIENLS